MAMTATRSSPTHYRPRAPPSTDHANSRTDITPPSQPDSSHERPTHRVRVDCSRLLRCMPRSSRQFASPSCVAGLLRAPATSERQRTRQPVPPASSPPSGRPLPIARRRSTCGHPPRNHDTTDRRAHSQGSAHTRHRQYWFGRTEGGRSYSREAKAMSPQVRARDGNWLALRDPGTVVLAAPHCSRPLSTPKA